MAAGNDYLSGQTTASNGREINGHVNGNSIGVSSQEQGEVPLSQTTRNSSPVQPPRHHKRKKAVYAESSSSTEDDRPLISSPAPRRTARAQKRRPMRDADSSSEDDVPLASSPGKQLASAAVPIPGAIDKTTIPTSVAGVKVNGKGSKEVVSDDSETPKKRHDNGKTNGTQKRATKRVKKEERSDSDDDSPVKQKKRKARKTNTNRAAGLSSDEDEKPPAKKRRIKKDGTQGSAKSTETASTPKTQGKGKAKANVDRESPKKGRKKKEEEEEEEEVFRWWEANGGDNSVKWTTLEHNGVLFPPPYEPLPPSIKMKYGGRAVDLPPESEEVAGFYAALIETEHAQDSTFNNNFFADWQKVLKEHPPRDGTKIISFEKCDFMPMYEYFEEEKAKKKALSSQEKKELKKAKDAAEAKYTYCLLDGRKEKVGNFRVEPPGLFRGRGDHPKKGSLKFRLRPEDIILNIGKEAPIPVPNIPGQWKGVQHDNTVTWLANWTENINQNHKYVFLAAGSSLKGQSDMLKFEKARELKNHIDRIRKNYTEDMRSKVMATRQRATAMYFIDRLALRAGNEKGADEADTVGCCSLRCIHVTLEAPNFIIFDFLGKDSIRYYNKVEVDAQIFRNIRIFKEGKDDEDDLFDRVHTATLNKHLTSEMKGLSAKVFRTFNASSTFQRLLDETNLEGATLQEKLNAYNKANRLVAILCNHQRSVPKTHDQSMEKLRHKVKGLIYDRMKLRHVLYTLDPKAKKAGKYADHEEDEEDIDDLWVVEYEEEWKKKEIEKAERKFAKENEKLQEEGKTPQSKSVLNEKIVSIEEEFERLAKERSTGKATLKRERPIEKIEENIASLTEKIKTSRLQLVDRDEGKEVALGTSKINYLDPRITAAWCKTHDFPIEKIFSKTLLTKFPWAMEVDEDWKF